MRTSDYLDDLECRDPELRERELMSRLPGLIERATSAPGWARKLGRIDPAHITSRAALAQLPVTRKSDLMDLQRTMMPFGGLNATPVQNLRRLFVSPGPIHEPEGDGRDWWRSARALYAAGIRSGHLIQNCFSYHLTPAAFLIEAGAARIGCPVIPAGTGQTELQVQVMSTLKADAYTGTPSFLKLIIEKAQEIGADIATLKHALVGAEAFPSSLRTWFREHGVPNVQQFYGTADLGVIAFETQTEGEVNPGLVLNEDVILEILDPRTGEPVPRGETGEMVVTVFNLDYPLIRFATGDLSAEIDAISPCGRTNMRIKGWLGRTDQATKVRGLFVQTPQVNEILRRHPRILKGRLVITRSAEMDVMTLYCEVADVEAAKDARDAIAATVRDVTKLRGEIVFVAPEQLPADGRLIEDARRYD